LERDGVQRADRTLTITEEGRDHYLDDCGADPDRVRVVSNTVDLETFEAADPIAGYEDEYVVAYVGSFGPHRGLETAIEAFPAVVENVPNPRLLLVGSAGEDAYDQRLRDLAVDSGVEERIEFTGWIDFEDVPAYIAAIDACFILHNDNPHTATTVPHKLFQHMALRRPVVVTGVGPLGRIVREYDAGRVVGDGDTVATVEAFLGLYDDETCEQVGANARRAVEERYNGSYDAERLCEMYDELQTESNERKQVADD
jgi:glycosyltransferase involved in cell wall biosynthesis